MAPRSRARGQANEWIRGARRPEGGGDCEVNPPYPVGAGDGDLGTNDSLGRGSSHGLLAVGSGGGGGGGRGKEGFGERRVLGGEVGECFDQFWGRYENEGDGEGAPVWAICLGSSSLSDWASGPFFRNAV